jgi:DNA methylase
MSVTIHLGDCQHIPEWRTAPILITDPPYPNNAGWFDGDLVATTYILATTTPTEALVFWNETHRPPVDLPLVAVHIWHRTNVNGRPYEPIYHFHADGRKRRSLVMQHPAIFDGAGPGCHEYLGHPTQKPVAVMRWLIQRTGAGIIADPFAGVGSTLIAARSLDRNAIGVERNEQFYRTAMRRLAQQDLFVEAQ